MTTNLRSFKVPCSWSHGTRQVSGFAMAYGTLAMLLLAGGTPAAMADPMPNRVFAECVLNTSSQGQQINTVAGLQEDILDANPPGNADEIQDDPPPEIAYVIIYAINNDNNGQLLVDNQENPVGFTGPVICVHPDFDITEVLQTTDIPDVDILDVQDALILRHTPEGAAASVEDANRTCHTTDGNTDCFDID